MLALTLRVLGVTVLDLSVNTDGPPDDDKPPPCDLDGGATLTVGFQNSGLILPSMADDD